MHVRIKVAPSGLINGQPWPAVGETIELPDVVAEAMSSVGHVEIVAEPTPEIERRPASVDAVEKRSPARPRGGTRGKK